MRLFKKWYLNTVFFLCSFFFFFYTLQTKDSFLVNKRSRRAKARNKIFWQKTLHCRNGLLLLLLLERREQGLSLSLSFCFSCKLWSRIWARDNATVYGYYSSTLIFAISARNSQSLIFFWIFSICRKFWIFMNLGDF